jgi:hypothetical protein
LAQGRLPKPEKIEGPIPSGRQPNERQDSLEGHARWIVVEAMIGRAHE